MKLYLKKFDFFYEKCARTGRINRMLDDLKYIHNRDGQDALGIAQKQWQQLVQEFSLQLEPRSFDNIILAGMGGSALAALIIQSWPGFSRPFEIVRNYDLPAYVSLKTLFFASSYSGNTEETVSALEAAEQRGAYIVIITSGGKLAEIAKIKNYPLLLLPTGFQPRHATLYSLKAIITVLDKFGITKNQTTELAGKAKLLESITKQWAPDIPTDKNQAKQIAKELIGKSIVIYSGPLLFPAAYKWKISFNENAKHIAWCNQLPEFNHNEILGWTEQPVQKPYAVVHIRSNLEHPRVQKRFEITLQLLSGKWPAPIVIAPKGDDLLEQLLWTIALGDFVSLYLALLNGLNPTPVDLIEKLKIALRN